MKMIIGYVFRGRGPVKCDDATVKRRRRYRIVRIVIIIRRGVLTVGDACKSLIFFSRII